MHKLVLCSVALMFPVHGALADTQSLNISDGDSVLLPPVASITQPSVSRTQALDGRSKAINVDLGNHFSTQLEAATIPVPDGHWVTNLPNGGGVAATSLMLNGLYEVSNGSWHLKPYVGGGFGYIDANSRVLGQTNSLWEPVYQVHGGVELGFTEKIFGSVEYRWTMGSMPGFYVAGIPARLSIIQHGFTLGFDYKY